MLAHSGSGPRFGHEFRRKRTTGKHGYQTGGHLTRRSKAPKNNAMAPNSAHMFWLPRIRCPISSTVNVASWKGRGRRQHHPDGGGKAPPPREKRDMQHHSKKRGESTTTPKEREGERRRRGTERGRERVSREEGRRDGESTTRKEEGERSTTHSGGGTLLSFLLLGGGIRREYRHLNCHGNCVAQFLGKMRLYFQKMFVQCSWLCVALRSMFWITVQTNLTFKQIRRNRQDKSIF